MSSARLIVSQPDFTLPPFSLESVVDWRDGDLHWRAGVEWETVCGDSDSTYDECVIVNATSGAATGTPVPFPEPPAKSATAAKQNFGATPFTVYAEVDCSAVGFYDDSTAWAEARLHRTEAKEIEKVFWTGVVAGQSAAQYPHLAANAAIADTEANGNLVQLQQAAVVVTGTPVCVEVALGLLESAFADCYSGQGIIHVPNELIPLFNQAYLLETEDGRLITGNGNVVVAGTGYPGTAPDGTVTAGARWIYMTPRIFGYRSDVRTFVRESTLDRTVNTVRAVAERTYVLGYDCCLVAVPVSLTCG